MLNKFWTSESAPVIRALDSGASPVLASGIGAAARAHMAAALRKGTGLPLFVVCPDEQAAEIMRRDLEALLSERAVLIGGRDFTFYTADGVTRQSEQKRIAALDALLSGTQVAVCSVSALVQRSIPPEALRRAAFTINAGAECPMEDVERALLRCGYVHRLQVDGPGQYSRRGGILDFFSPAHDSPVRIEFWGDEIDSMGFFDIDSQRRTENVVSCRILPAAETLPSLHEGGENALADELSLAAARFARSQRSESRRLSENLCADGERLRETKALSAADRYMALIYPKFACALDYIGEEALVFIDQPAKTGKLADEQMKLLHEDLRTLLQSGSLIPSQAEYRMSWSECAQRLCEHPMVMGDSFTQGRCDPEPRAIVGITAKQLPSYGGSLETAAEDVRHYLSTGFAVLVLASDERRCGLLGEFFERHDITSRQIKSVGEDFTSGECVIAPGALSGGFEYPLSRLAVLTDAQMLHAGFRKGKKKKTASNRRRLDSCADLSVGDLVVHEHHGIGRFAGIVKMKVDGVEKDYIKICYAGTDCL